MWNDAMSYFYHHFAFWKGDMNMPSITERLEKVADKLMDNIEEKPFKSIVIGLLLIWLISKVIKAIK